MSFTQRSLPWAVAGAALLFYVIMLSGEITALGIGNLARTAGWAWQPVFTGPVHYILTLPIRWLPANVQIAAFNLFAIVCASLTLALLARSVTLLPHDRTRDQRQYEHSENGLLSISAAWVPPVLAVLACGLQRTFWEHAVIGTGEMLDLLIFAYVIRCLLEYRVSQRDSWLSRMALVYGLGVTNNFALIGFFPAMLAAVIWIKGRSFFNLRFILRMALLGLAGLSFYLVLPLVQLSYEYVDVNVWQALRLNWVSQKNMLAKFPRFMLLIFGFSSLVPVLFMGIKWPASLGDISNVGNALTNIMTHVLHGLFLGACVYVAFDPALSPRKMAGMFGYPMLSFYYLGALSIGYFSGYFLLVFSGVPLKSWQRPSMLQLALNRALVGVVWVGLVALPAGLVYKNWTQLQATTGKYLAQYGATAVQQLKEAAPKGGLVMSDDTYRAFATYSALKRQGIADQYAVVETSSLSYPAYHRFLHDRYPRYWPVIASNLPPTAIIDNLTLIQLITHLNKTNEVFYLHPSFGYYFERFYPQPQKLLYQLKIFSTNMVDDPVLSEAQVRQNDQFWSQLRSGPLKGVSAALKACKAKNEPNDTLSQIGSMYSRSLNFFGVELQQAGMLDKAGEYFSAALELNPENPSAFLNLEYNKSLRAGKRGQIPLSEAAKKRLEPYGDNIEAMLMINGPIDEPSLCYKLAEVFARGRNFRQAAQYLQRILVFEPENLPARLGLISMLNQIRQHDRALQMIAELRGKSQTNALSAPAQLDLVQSEVGAYVGRNEIEAAKRILLAAQRTYPTNVEPFSMMAELYLSGGDVTNAVKVLENEIKLQPEQPSPLINLARIKILSNQFAEAIPYLDNALKLQGKDPYALLNRAIAHLKTGNLNAADSDYRSLYSMLPKVTYPIAYGLHEVAWQKKDRKQATKWAKEYLKLAPPGAPEVKVVQERLERAKSGSI